MKKEKVQDTGFKNKKAYSNSAVWYKTLGYKKDPCTILPTDNLIGMDNLKEELKEWIVPSKNICLLFGNIGTGKSSLLFTIKKELENDGINAIYIDSKTFSGRDGLNLIDEVYPDYKGYEKLKKRGVLNKIKKLFVKIPNTVLLLDEFQKLPSNLTDQIEGNFNIGIFYSVICSQQKEEIGNCSGSFLQRLGEKKFQTIELDSNQCLQLIEERFERQILKEDILKAIISESKKVPRVVLENLQRIFIHLNRSGQLGNKATAQGVVRLTGDELTEMTQKGIIRFELPKESYDGPDIKEKTRKISNGSVKSKILESLARSPKTQKELQEAVGTSLAGVRKEISNLVKEGKLSITKATKPKKYSVNHDERVSQVKD